ncbi:MAG: transporter substrate-binding domain-containing protein [Bacteroidales bacterium]|nr:transporter substrate-binding domain-containing protein [Bacteroidales bacterium]
MSKYLYFLSRIISLLVLVVIIFSCQKNDLNKSELPQNEELSNLDLIQIKERGKIVAVTSYNSVNYFMYKGLPMGYQFEMLKLLAEDLHVSLEIVVNNDNEDTFAKLNSGEYDIIANNLTITPSRLKQISFTSPLTNTKQVLIQRTQDDKSALQNHFIKEINELEGKTIYVQQGTVFVETLQELSTTFKTPITIIELPEEQEDIIKLISKGEINYTVCDENVAQVNQTYYSNIDINISLSNDQQIAWGVRKTSSHLLNAINNWLYESKKTGQTRILYTKYFNNKRSKNIINSEYYTLSSGKISVFDEIIKQKSQLLNWDWRMVSSMIYQESRFNPDAESWVGAYGIMQLMPNTAILYGVDKESSTDEQITAGIKHLRYLDKKITKLGITDQDQRIKFVLASYNVGLGHILDARRLAEKYGKDPNVWDNNVDFFILNKSKPQYYKDPIVRYGYARGSETYNYVKEINDRYEHYKNLADLN